MSDANPHVSVVVAVWDSPAGLADCLGALDAQIDSEAEIIVVAGVEPPSDLVARFQQVRWMRFGEDLLIPELWARGMARARGRIVAITTAHFAPAPDWLQQVRAAHRRCDSVGIGGRIDPPAGGSLVDWATYFLRYSRYLMHDREQRVADLAGDNASYRREVLMTHRATIAEGFWEPEFHRRILAQGETLTFNPAISVVQRASYRVRAFCRQRVLHGRRFGASRMSEGSLAARLARATAAPLIPFVLLFRIGWRVARSERDLTRFLGALPLLGLFVLAWVAGEVWGYLTLHPPRPATTDGSPNVVP